MSSAMVAMRNAILWPQQVRSLYEYVRKQADRITMAGISRWNKTMPAAMTSSIHATHPASSSGTRTTIESLVAVLTMPFKIEKSKPKVKRVEKFFQKGHQ